MFTNTKSCMDLPGKVKLFIFAEAHGKGRTERGDLGRCIRLRSVHAANESKRWLEPRQAGRWEGPAGREGGASVEFQTEAAGKVCTQGQGSSSDLRCEHRQGDLAFRFIWGDSGSDRIRSAF